MLLNSLISLYKDEDDESSVHGIDLITPLSYTTLPSRLTNGTRESLLKALQYKKQFPGAVLAFSNPNHSGFRGCDARECELKKQLIGTVPNVRAGTCSNSIQEAEAVKAAIPFAPKAILVICGQAHSRSARIIWDTVFPDATVIIRCIPYACEYQADHPFGIERYAWPWFFASLARHALLHVLGIERMRSMKHDTK